MVVNGSLRTRFPGGEPLFPRERVLLKGSSSSGLGELWEGGPSSAQLSKRLWETRSAGFSKVVVGGRREERRDRPKAGRAFRGPSTSAGRLGSFHSPLRWIPRRCRRSSTLPDERAKPGSPRSGRSSCRRAPHLRGLRLQPVVHRAAWDHRGGDQAALHRADRAERRQGLLRPGLSLQARVLDLRAVSAFGYGRSWTPSAPDGTIGQERNRGRRR